MLTFVVLKSISLGLNAARGIALAVMLGPESYGVFGTLVVVQQYLSYVALGMREGVAISLARSEGSELEESAVYSSSLAWGVGSAIVVFAAMTSVSAVIERNSASVVLVGLISAFSIVNEILININRHESKLKKIALVELAYNAIVIASIWFWWQSLTVSLALLGNLFGLMVGVSIYVFTLRRFGWASASWEIVKNLIGIGFMPGVFSAALVVLGSCYVIAANAMNLGDAIGLVVFGSNIGALILFALNTVSWALASRSMSRLYAPVSPDREVQQTATADAFFRFGIVGAVVLALSTQLLFATLLSQYEGAEVYVLYFCLFQSYGLLLFSEISFANVNGAMKPIIAGYFSLVLAFLLGYVLFPSNFVALLDFSIVAHFALALWIVLYCRRLGFEGGRLVSRVGALAFPLACAFAYRGGPWVVLAICVAFFAVLLFVDGGKLLAAFTGHRLRRFRDI